MALFEPAIEITLANEGGYVNDPMDPGGETNFGISKRDYPKLDIKNLTKEEATAIYLRDFWKFGGIIDQAVANKVFDSYVNMEHIAIFLLQEIVLQVIKPDGIYGEVTEDAVNRLDPNTLLTDYRAKLTAHYKAIVVARPEEEKFLKGWLRRAQQ